MREILNLGHLSSLNFRDEFQQYVIEDGQNEKIGSENKIFSFRLKTCQYFNETRHNKISKTNQSRKIGENRAYLLRELINEYIVVQKLRLECKENRTNGGNKIR